MDELTLQEQSLQEQIEWRKKVRNIDASLHTVLRDAVEDKTRKPLLARVLSADDAVEASPAAPAKRSFRGFRLGFHAGT